MTKRVVYLSGAIHGCVDPHTWRRGAAERLNAAGFIGLSPFDFDFDPEREREEVFAFDTFLSQRSLCVLADLRTPSWGTAHEICAAYDAGVPVVGWLGPAATCHVSIWATYKTTHSFFELSDALSWIIADMDTADHKPLQAAEAMKVAFDKTDDFISQHIRQSGHG